MTQTDRFRECGKRLRLREGVFKQLRDREWILSRVENDLIFLVHQSGAYGVVVDPKDIDLNEPS